MSCCPSRLHQKHRYFISIYNWTYSNASWNPSGLSALGEQIGAGWMFYLHMYCDDSPMWQRFPSITNTQPMSFWGHS